MERLHLHKPGDAPSLSTTTTLTRVEVRAETISDDFVLPASVRLWRLTLKHGSANGLVAGVTNVGGSDTDAGVDKGQRDILQPTRLTKAGTPHTPPSHVSHKPRDVPDPARRRL